MPYQILGKKLVESPTNYSGTYRATPAYHNELSENDPFNQLFLRYLDACDNSLLLQDEHIAKELTKQFSQFTETRNYELIKINSGKRQNGPADFLGFDISTGFYSLLSWGLQFRQLEIPTRVHQADYQIARPMIYLVEDHFFPKLNRFGLFDTYEVAMFCLQCLMSIQSCFPNLLENDDVKFDVVSIERILSL